MPGTYSYFPKPKNWASTMVSNISAIDTAIPVIKKNYPKTGILTNEVSQTLNKVITSKPKLISKSELDSLGSSINIVGFNVVDLITETNKTFSPRIINWVEPYEIKNIRYTLFYTDVDTNLKVGDRVFIINGNYDSDLLIQSNKYRRGRDGYKILYIDKCRIVLDIKYTGVKPYLDEVEDNFIKIHYIRDYYEFIHANRNITTRDGNVNNKFSYYQNNIAFIDQDYSTSINWGFNNGVSGTPGFFVRDSSFNWTDITSPLINSGSYSYALSPTYSNVDRIKILNGDFKYGGTQFREGFVYQWVVGPTYSRWEVDPRYFRPMITKSNFRDGNFKGIWNSGLFGQQSKRIKWEGDTSTWNVGTLVNTTWLKGDFNSIFTSPESYFSSFDSYGLPYQKVNAPDNAGRGYNFVFDSNFESVTIKNGSIYRATFGTSSATYSVVENEIMSYQTPYKINTEKAFFDSCTFYNSYLLKSELKNCNTENSKIEKSKSINSYLSNSVFKTSNYNSENIIKIFGYDEFNASEYQTSGSTFSYINNVTQKVYKFYIDKTGYQRLKNGNIFYIKGLKFNNNIREVINFFDKKFRIDSYTEYVDDLFTQTTSGKRGIEVSTFLSTPSDNSYKYTSVENGLGGDYYTRTYATSSNNKYYSLDIWVSTYDTTLNSIIPTSAAPDFNTGGTASVDSPFNNPSSLGNIVDISNAYIVDSDFDSGLFESSNWNSGEHIEESNDTNITTPGYSGGTYNLSFNTNGYIVATTSYDLNYPESNGFKVGDVVYLDSVDFISGSTASRLPDSYKIVSISNGVYQLQELITGTTSQILPLTASTGYFATNLAQNRLGNLRKLKIKKADIKSGLFRRSYITDSLIQNTNYDQHDRDLINLDKIRNLIVSDSIFSNNANYLSTATYVNSVFLSGSDVWYSGVVKDSIWIGLTFGNGVIRDSRWVSGVFEDGYFYNSRTFNANATSSNPYYYSENTNSYYKDGGSLPNNRNSWQDGVFLSGEFIKSDWEFGTFSNGRFYYSKWYDGIFKNGTIGSNQLSVTDTHFYNGTVSYATVENATLYAIDTSYPVDKNQNITWINGVFNNGLFGSDILQPLTHSATWLTGQFNGGQFVTKGKWKDGTFNGGKFISGYGWTQSDYLTASYYGWEKGTFNGGEFGNANGLTNSTWYTGSFNNGIFKGRVWNNGIFSYGEFQGSGQSPIGGPTCASASIFVDSYSYSYWGLWRNGIFTETKDKFIKDDKLFTTLVRSRIPERRKSPAKFKNGLWISGTFSHFNGQMSSSVWLDGAFTRGRFISSSFNPYVKRNGSATASFNLNDNTCYWENGSLENSDFYISRWKGGNFILGTATGAIFENGVASYMNAFNVFWQNGLWRNGNWYGSSFDFNYEVTDDYVKQILYRGMSWSGTSSCHVWNVFLESTDNEATVISATANTPTGVTGNPSLVQQVAQQASPGGGYVAG